MRLPASSASTSSRNPNDQRDITHNLRTAVIGPDGIVMKIYTGNEWTPDDHR